MYEECTYDSSKIDSMYEFRISDMSDLGNLLLLSSIRSA